MARKPPPQAVIDEWAAKYNQGFSVRHVAAKAGVSYGTVHRYLTTHPTVAMRGRDGKPRPSRPTGAGCVDCGLRGGEQHV